LLLQGVSATLDKNQLEAFSTDSSNAATSDRNGSFPTENLFRADELNEARS
jgi:hypothetical protein